MAPWDDTRAVAELLGEKTSSDILLYSGEINYAGAVRTLARCESKRRANGILFLVTFGGDPDAGYRIGRHLQQTYTRLTVVVPSWCKSSGTLIVTAAHELAMAGRAELGPLDVQMAKPDEVDELRSGFIVNDAFEAMQKQALEMLRQCVIDLKKNTAGATITGKTAIQTASSLTGSLFGHLYAQVDPMHMGEAYRAGRVAREYGQRLSEIGGNLKDKALDNLISGYPSHSFVIDRNEATQLFNSVRPLSEDEAALVTSLGFFAAFPWGTKSPLVEFLSLTGEESRNAESQQDGGGADDTKSEGGSDGDGAVAEGAHVTPIRQAGE